MVQQLRSQVARLADKADLDLAAVWRAVETPDQAFSALHDVLPALVQQYGSGAATLAAIWYDDERARRAVRGRFQAITADLGAAGADALAGYGTAAVARHAGVNSDVRTLVAGGVQRRIANYARQTIVTSSLKDPGAQGWVRVGLGECDWCQQYLDGEIHYIEGYDFNAHDHCQCYAEPAW